MVITSQMPHMKILFCFYFPYMRGSKVDTDLVAPVLTTWRSELSKIDIWYASFGSNMWKSRFLCYIEGGQVKFQSLQKMSLTFNLPKF